jgi:MoaA/NifB/PqqE/SkfB family radical SAM enzyme
MENKIASYTAASVFPAKILVNPELLKKITEEKMIPPIHIQLNPTNHCNLNCPFCSCSARDKRQQMSYADIDEFMTKARRLGCESATITGGGEPCLHPDIEKIISRISELGIEIGLVTNGLIIEKLSKETMSKITWIRISSGDHRNFTDTYKKSLERAIEKGDVVDWSFSHVVTKKPNYDTIKAIIKFANNNVFTHVRLVADIFEPEKIDMEKIKKKVSEAGISDEIVIYQGRKDFMPGQEKCLISLLKPVIGADGFIYPCCGTQYALEEPGRDYEKTMRMGEARDLEKIIENQAHFNGAVCSKCYYNEYNEALKILISEVHHKKFV